MKKLVIIAFLLGASLIINKCFASQFEAYNGNLYDGRWQDGVFHITYLGVNKEVIVFEKRTIEKNICKDTTQHINDCVVDMQVKQMIINTLTASQNSCTDLNYIRILLDSMQENVVNAKTDTKCTTGSQTIEYQHIIEVSKREGTPKTGADIW